MELETVNELIEKFTQRITVKSIKSSRKVVVVFFVFSLCFLLSIKDYVSTIVLFVLTVGEFVYLSVIRKQKVLKLYNAVGSSIVLALQAVLSFDTGMFCIQKILGCFDGVLIAVIILVELLCLFFGFFYTYRCVKNGTVYKIKTAASSFSIFPGIVGCFSARYIIRNADTNTQNIFFTAVFTVCCSILLFALGMTHVAILYFIKKHHIPNRELHRSTEP